MYRYMYAMYRYSYALWSGVKMLERLQLILCVCVLDRKCVEQRQH